MGLLSTIRSRIGGQSAQIAELAGQVDDLKARVKFGKSESSGVKRSGDQFDYEFNSNLKGKQRLLTFDKMLADPHVAGAMLNITLPLRNAEWEMQPASKDDRDVEIAEFCAANLLQQSSDRYGPEFYIREPWKAQRLPEILTSLSHGFSIFKKVWKSVGTKVVYERLQWLETSSVDPRGFILDGTDNITSILRTYTNAGNLTPQLQEPLEPEGIALYVWGLLGARYEGTPFIRPLYGPWWRNDKVQKWSTIGAQKAAAGVPIVQYPRGASTETKLNAVKLARAMRGEAPAEAYAAFQQGDDGQMVEVKYAGSDLKIDSMRGLIDGNNADMAHGAKSKSQLLGETASGSRALGQSLGMTDSLLPEAVAETIADQESCGVANIQGVLFELVNRNFGSVRALPKLIAPKLNQFEKLAMVKQVVELVNAKVLPRHEALSRQVANWFDFDLPDEAFEVLADIPEPLLAPPGQPPTDPNKPVVVPPTPAEGDQPGDVAAAAALSAHSEFKSRIEHLLEPNGGARRLPGSFRAPNFLESRFVNLAAVDGAIRKGTRDGASVMGQAHRRMIADLMGRLKRGEVTARNLEGQSRSLFKGRKKAERELRVVLKATGESAMGDVENEIEAQVKVTEAVA